MTERKNLVRLNLPLVPGQELPDPTRPIISIDDKEIVGVRRLRVEAGVGEFSLVRLEFYADVEGAAHAGTDSFRDVAEFKIAKLELGPDDAIVSKVPNFMNSPDRAQLLASLRDAFPLPRKIILLEGGHEIAVLSGGAS